MNIKGEVLETEMQLISYGSNFLNMAWNLCSLNNFIQKQSSGGVL